LAGIVGFVTGAVLVAPSSAGATPPQYTLEERTTAIVGPSLVYVEMVYTGYLRNKQTNEPLWPSPVVYNRACSGFVVNGDGHVLTTLPCVKPSDETVRLHALNALGRTMIADKKLDSKELDNFVKTNLGQTAFTGQDPATPAEARLFGQFEVATGGKTDSPAIPGKIVTTTESGTGNLALVKLEQGNLPAVELSQAAAPEQGAPLFLTAFATTDNDPRTGAFTAVTKSVKVIGTGTRGESTVYRTNGDVGGASQGGMAVDSDGRVVGMIDSDLALSDRANRAIIQMPAITALLGTAGVSNTLSDNDKRYRRGLDAYFGGRYDTAISELGAVASSDPRNRTAQTYRQYALDRQKIEAETSPGTPSWLVPTIAAAGGALVVGLIALFIMLARRRRRPKVPFNPYPSSAPLALPGPPVSPPASFSAPPYPVSPAPQPYAAAQPQPYAAVQPLSPAPQPYEAQQPQPYAAQPYEAQQPQPYAAQPYAAQQPQSYAAAQPYAAQPHAATQPPISGGAPIYYPHAQPTSPAPNTGQPQYVAPQQAPQPQHTGQPEQVPVDNAWQQTQPIPAPQPVQQPQPPAVPVVRHDGQRWSVVPTATPFPEAGGEPSTWPKEASPEVQPPDDGSPPGPPLPRSPWAS
jgi:hypothetical protein